ncbi:retrovirus-related Pol polyprotein from transposon 17.6 [Trichonephila clavipes]|nr:retrovirus-related Pol polyprotein from transposon 17.6 [Trichonephila clavipes]
MPFGLCNAPTTFEPLMETVFGGLSYETCLVYLDDLIIVGSSFEEHLKNIRRVLQKLKEAILKLSPFQVPPIPALSHLFRAHHLDERYASHERSELRCLKRYMVRSVSSPILASFCPTRKKLLCEQEGTACYRKSREELTSLALRSKVPAEKDHASLTRLLNFKNLEGRKDPIVHRVKASSTSALDPWIDESVRKDQLADPELTPIIEFKE